MKNKLRLTILSVMAAGAVLCTCAAVAAGTQSDANSQLETFSDTTQGSYTLALVDGEIIVTSDSSSLKTGISGQWLRQSDQAALKSGITVKSYEEVLQLLEDFSS